MQRRNFLKLATSAAACYGLPASALAAAKQGKAAKAKYVIMLELKGGNDGLNTIVPYRDPLYKKLRPALALDSDQVIPFSGQHAFHPQLADLKTIWDREDMAIINGVGYPDPNRSHFRSIEIWETASDSHEFLQNGWVSRFYPNAHIVNAAPADGVVIGNDAGPLAGGHIRTVMMRNIDQFMKRAKRANSTEHQTNNAALQHLLSVRQDVRYAAHRFEETIAKSKHDIGVFPEHRLGKDFETAVRMIVSNTQVPIIKLSHGGFDTHANQLATQARLLGQLSESLLAFEKAMKKMGLWDQVLVMTYSEFGRRPKENASKGTDHGTAAPHFILGGKVKGGLYGKQPSLSDLENQDLRFAVDYRSLYNTVAHQWWSVKSDVLPVKQYPLVNCLRV